LSWVAARRLLRRAGQAVLRAPIAAGPTATCSPAAPARWPFPCPFVSNTTVWAKARTLSPGLDRLLDNLPAGSPPPASADLQRAIGLFNRMASYLDKTRPI